MRKFLFMISIWLMSTPALSAPEMTDATKDLYRQIDLLKEIQVYVERVDLARIFVIRNSISNVIENMESNLKNGKKEITMETMRLLQNLIIQYRFSTVFFGWQEPIPITSIYVPILKVQFDELHKLSKTLEEEYGFDDSPYTQVTANTFRQMHKLLQELDALPVTTELKTDLRALWAPVGETVAIAQQGDRPKTFNKAIETIELIRKLYPQFNQVGSSAAGFTLVMELQGLAEFFAEYAQMD